jgi:hypothetical protein
MTAEMTAFAIRYAIGMPAPSDITPGMFINAALPDGIVPSETEIAWLNSIRFGTLDQGEMTPLIDFIKMLITQMYEITRTPAPQSIVSVSGEALKQAETGLLGKARYAQVNFGNSWENAFNIAHRLESSFALNAPPAFDDPYALWGASAMRDQTLMVQNALAVAKFVDRRTFLELLGNAYDWDTAKIYSIERNMDTEATREIGRLAQNAFGDPFAQNPDNR